MDEPGRYGQPTPNYKCEKIPTTLYQTKQRLVYELYVVRYGNKKKGYEYIAYSIMYKWTFNCKWSFQVFGF